MDKNDEDEGSTHGLESSDTESSKELGRDDDNDDEDEEEVSLPTTPNKTTEPPKLTAEEIMEDLIREAKLKAKELQEKSKLSVKRLIIFSSMTIG